MFKFKRKETEEEKLNRILSLTEDVDCGLCPPPMNAQVAMNELCRYLLGDDFYIVMPVNQEQANTEIVCAIENRYKESNNK